MDRMREMGMAMDMEGFGMDPLEDSAKDLLERGFGMSEVPPGGPSRTHRGTTN